jgi:hypothetical protein
MTDVNISSASYSAKDGGWYLYCVSTIDGTSRSGPEFVKAGPKATVDHLVAAVIALYQT